MKRILIIVIVVVVAGFIWQNISFNGKLEKQKKEAVQRSMDQQAHYDSLAAVLTHEIDSIQAVSSLREERAREAYQKLEQSIKKLQDESKELDKLRDRIGELPEL